ncbi:hypothetical protein DFH27DRAFT_90243 [Peziza echinospora]|nr:hypothetical protein DFH27DRAFT_90243 [Peziza echinospora]
MAIFLFLFFYLISACALWAVLSYGKLWKTMGGLLKKKEKKKKNERTATHTMAIVSQKTKPHPGSSIFFSFRACRQLTCAAHFVVLWIISQSGSSS